MHMRKYIEHEKVWQYINERELQSSASFVLKVFRFINIVTTMTWLRIKRLSNGYIWYIYIWSLNRQCKF